MRASLDANVILRLLAEDEPGQTRRAASVFESAAAGKLELVVTPSVLFEVAWTLRSAYDFPREKILSVLADLLSTPGVTVTDENTVAQAIQMARDHGLEFTDAYIAAAAEALGIRKIITFNSRDFRKTPLELLRF